MKHPSSRELFDYWNQRRGRRPAPERADIEPGAIRRVLADTFILSFEPRMGHPFRLAGTRVCALFGRELKGEAFLDLWPAHGRKEMRDLLAIVAHESVGVVASVSGASTAGAALSLEFLALPLGHHGQTTRLLGALAPSEPPTWLATSAVVDLRLGTHRRGAWRRSCRSWPPTGKYGTASSSMTAGSPDRTNALNRPLTLSGIGLRSD
jgi:hypothetical protein